MPNILDREGARLAYEFTPGTAPAVVFLGGFKSDMQGTKALSLEAWAKARGQAFLRLDYSGHGQSGGAFEAGTIGHWYQDARAVIEHEIERPCVLVGSSMGGWIALLIARESPRSVAGLVTVAAAPDFTEDGYWASFTPEQRVALVEKGRVSVPSDYGEPYVITQRLIEDGRRHLVLRDPLHLPFATRFLQGTADRDVPPTWAQRLFDHVEGDDVMLTLVKGADHRFSEPDLLLLLQSAVEDVVRRAVA
jgi:pimeloyl-ACP methyl ester carboxylesterase